MPSSPLSPNPRRARPRLNPPLSGRRLFPFLLLFVQVADQNQLELGEVFDDAIAPKKNPLAEESEGTHAQQHP